MSKQPIGVVLTDTHLTKNNTADVEEIWLQGIDLAEELKINKIYHGGDIVTAREAQPLNVLLSIQKSLRDLAEAGMQVDAILGNHDLVNQEAFEGYPSIFNCSHFKVHGESYSYDHGTVVVHMLSYFPEKGSYKDRLETLKTNIVPGKKNILITHIGVNGGLSHANATINKEVPAGIFDGFDKVLIGHYHNQCQIEGYEIYYIGSTHQQNFGEDVNKGFTVIYDDGSHEFVKSDMPEYHTYHKNVEEADSKFLKELKNLKESTQNHIRVVLTGDESKLKSVDKKAFAEAGVNRLQLKDESVAIRKDDQESTFVNYDKEQLIKEYELFSVDQEIDSELGLDYLKSL